MPIKLEKIDDILKLLSITSLKPKKMIFDLSKDGMFYHTKIYIDIIDRDKNKKNEGYIECKSDISFVKNFSLVYDNNDENAEIFSIVVPE